MSRHTYITKKIKDDKVIDTSITTITNKQQSEPPFIKLYLQDISRLNGLSNGESNVLYEFVKLIDYENRIQLSKYIKEDIANNKLNCSIKLIEKTLYQCINKGIFMKLGSNTFLANPNIFGKGEWKNILKVVMTISYDKTGKMQIINKTYENLENDFNNMVEETLTQYNIAK